MNTPDRGAMFARRLSPRSSIAWLTGAVGAGTLAVSVTALASSAVLQTLTRDLGLLRSGQWWRLITPVLVQPDGWGQLVFNMLGITIVGVALEGRTSRGVWTFTYLLGGIGGIVAASIWQPADHSGGSSDAVAALIGALSVLCAADKHNHQERRSKRVGSQWPAQLYCVFFAGYLTALDLGGVWWSILIGDATIIAFVVARHAVSTAALAWASLLFVVAAGAVMAVQHDGHGVGIIAGAATASAILLRRRGVPGALTS